MKTCSFPVHHKSSADKSGPAVTLIVNGSKTFQNKSTKLESKKSPSEVENLNCTINNITTIDVVPKNTEDSTCCITGTLQNKAVELYRIYTSAVNRRRWRPSGSQLRDSSSRTSTLTGIRVERTAECLCSSSEDNWEDWELSGGCWRHDSWS